MRATEDTMPTLDELATQYPANAPKRALCALCGRNPLDATLELRARPTSSPNGRPREAIFRQDACAACAAEAFLDGVESLQKARRQT